LHLHGSFESFYALLPALFPNFKEGQVLLGGIFLVQCPVLARLCLSSRLRRLQEFLQALLYIMKPFHLQDQDFP